MNTELVQQIADIAADIFGVDVADIQAATTPNDIEAWDSLAHLNLLVALEDEFAIRIVPEDMESTTDIASIPRLVDASRE